MILSDSQVGDEEEEELIMEHPAIPAPCCPHPGGGSQSPSSIKGEHGAGLGHRVLSPVRQV